MAEDGKTRAKFWAVQRRVQGIALQIFTFTEFFSRCSDGYLHVTKRDTTSSRSIVVEFSNFAPRAPPGLFGPRGLEPSCPPSLCPSLPKLEKKKKEGQLKIKKNQKKKTCEKMKIIMKKQKMKNIKKKKKKKTQIFFKKRKSNKLEPPRLPSGPPIRASWLPSPGAKIPLSSQEAGLCARGVKPGDDDMLRCGSEMSRCFRKKQCSDRKWLLMFSRRRYHWYGLGRKEPSPCIAREVLCTAQRTHGSVKHHARAVVTCAAGQSGF